MGFQQDTIIYIDEQDKLDASAAANAFADKKVKNRAYVNTLGAELAVKYLASENINVSEIYNMHSIKKILEELDISDVMLPNIHIDVRVVFDENLIFIPKSHFEYNLVPDIYLVFNLAKDFSHVKFLGFFEPKLINKNNQNNDYYFIEKEKLNPVSDLKNYIEEFKGNTVSAASPQEIENSERIIMAMTDNDISEDEKQYLIKQLTKSSELRDKFIEYENFETLSYKAMTDPQITKKEIEDTNSQKDNFDTVTDLNEFDTVNSKDNIEIFDSIENFDNLEIDPMDDVNETSFNDTQTDKEDNKNNSLDDLTNLAATTAFEAAAGMSAVAETELSELADTGEKVVDAVDKTLDIVDSGLEIAKDMVTEKTEAPESITFDDIDTSSLDNISQSTDENYEEETISFDNIETSENSNNIDYIDKIDNKISFDDIETTNEITNIEEPENPTETISLEGIDPSFMEDSSNLQDTNQEQTISLDDFDMSNIDENIDLDGDIPSIEDEQTNEEDIIDSTENLIDEPEVISLDDETIQPDEPITDLAELSDIENIAENSNELDIEPLDVENETDTEELNITQEADENSEVDSSDITQTPELAEFPDIPEINEITEIEQPSEGTDLYVENTDEDIEKSSGFGKNLLENMAQEDLNKISIDDLELDETPTSQNAEEITSDELLSQIDNLLNVESDKQEENLNEESTEPAQEQNIITQTDEDELDNIPDIDSLVSSSEMPETPVSNTLPPEFNKISNNEDSEISDTDIDESSDSETLAASTQEENSENETVEDDKLGVLFNDTDPTSDPDIDEITTNTIEETEQTDETQPIPGAAFLKPKKAADKKTLITAAALITILAGASAFVLLKPKSDTASDISSIAPAASDIINKPEQNKTANENILETNAPTINKPAAKTMQKSKQVKELKNTPAKKPISSESYLDVKRLVWDVPDVLSYSPKIQDYLRTAGKSIKLSLSADLLLATEYAYSNQVKVGLKLSKDGNILESKIISSSGSNEIDNIVLQSVKSTLNVVKPPSNEINTPDFNLNLIIYF